MRHLTIAIVSIIMLGGAAAAASPDDGPTGSVFPISPSEAILDSVREAGIWDDMPADQREELEDLLASLDTAEAQLEEQIATLPGQLPMPKLLSASVEACNGDGACGGTYKNNNTYGHYAYNTGDYWGCSNNTLSPIISFSLTGSVQTCSQYNSNKIDGDIEGVQECIDDSRADPCSGVRVKYVVLITCTLEGKRAC